VIVDCHTHVASADVARYPMLPGQDWFHGGVVDVDELLATTDGAGVDRAVVVQYVGAYGYDCRYAADAVASAPARLALVTAVALADLPAVHCKVSTHVLEPTTDPGSFVAALAASFGADRLCWGSDFPQTQSMPYAAMVDLARRASEGLDDAGRDAFLGGTSML